MSAISVVLLLAAGLALAVCAAALRAARALRAEVSGLRADLAAAPGTEPAARHAPPDEELIRAAVADALADERERELAEARRYWAEQTARDAAENGGGAAGYVPPGYEDALLDALLERYLTEDGGAGPDAPFVPRQGSGDRPAGFSAGDRAGFSAGDRTGFSAGDDEDDGWSAELAAARRRHPSHPGFNLAGEPVERPADASDQPAEVDGPAATGDGAHGHARDAAAGDGAADSPEDGAADCPEDGAQPVDDEHRRTAERLSLLAETATPLADVRPGPLGTLDVFLFADGTTLCLSPGHRETASRLATAARAGRGPVLLGGSGVSGAYALTFGCGDESIYLLADRIVTA